MREQPAVVFSRWVRDTDSFTRTVARWLDCAVRYELCSQIRGVLRPCDLLALDVPAGGAVLRRQGVLWAPLPDGGSGRMSRIVADVRSVVLVEKLTVSGERALARGDVPLGEIYAPSPVRRHTHAVVRRSVTDSRGVQALQVLATLTVSGRPVATVEELVYQRLLDNFHGQPA